MHHSDYSTITDSYLDISYSELTIHDPDVVHLTVGDRSVDLFLDPSYFPLYVDDQQINLSMTYNSDVETMSIQRVESGGDSFYGHGDIESEASMETFEMSDYQRTVAFLYLLGVVLYER